MSDTLYLIFVTSWNSIGERYTIPHFCNFLEQYWRV